MVSLPTERLMLEPLTIKHAAGLQPVLADPALYAVIGGEPPTLAVLRDRFEHWQRRQSPDGKQLWLNWVLVQRDGGAPVGYIQATVENDEATISYVVGAVWQRQGLATEAVGAMVNWLRAQGILTVSAHIEPHHVPSEAVARKVGLLPTGMHDDDGEQIWTAMGEALGA